MQRIAPDGSHFTECPDGRDIIVISNDITLSIGSFGPKEDMLFQRASELARRLKLPRIYLAANSGARIGIAKEVLAALNVAWEDPADPEKGFRYLYLTPEDHATITNSGKEGKGENVVNTQLVQEGGESRYMISDIIGLSDDMGVENLSAAAMIAGETSQAYQDVVTMSMVSARAIGIGSYLVRLGQRVVQVENSAIILTGAGALNKLLGREVYTSNTQLGGVQVRHSARTTESVIRAPLLPNETFGVYNLCDHKSMVLETPIVSLCSKLEIQHDSLTFTFTAFTRKCT